MLELLDAEADDLVLDEVLAGLQGVDVREVHGEFDEVLAGLGVVHLLPQRAA